ncbi:hypothetical protein [uncultured Intestinimonas sp.]|uniref:hypothetical protein n=1 Tax=uncultured Intestinimonas sp. TaxID=1689265 RepID=UPI0025D83A6C|nr:hypothetical protein [uncultured Intestinimonas sp.]
MAECVRGVGELGLESVRLGCFADNRASRRTIAACGGWRLETKPDLDGRPVELWQISIAGGQGTPKREKEGKGPC